VPGTTHPMTQETGIFSYTALRTTNIPGLAGQNC